MAEFASRIAGSSTTKDTFLSAIKPLLVLKRVFALSPISTIPQDGTFQIITQKALICSIVTVMGLYLYAFLASLLRLMRLGLQLTSPLLLTYSFGRLLISALTHAAYWCHSPTILAGYQAVGDLEIRISKTSKFGCVFTPVLFIFTITIMIFVAKNDVPDVFNDYLSVTAANLSAVADIIAGVVPACVCSELYFQVTVLRQAIAQLRQRIKTTLKQPVPLQAISIRPIMKHHRQLREVCAILNEGYGILMLLVTSGLSVEITYCVFLFLSSTSSLSRAGNLYCLFWALSQTLPATMVMGQCQQAQSENDQILSISSDAKALELHGTVAAQLEILEWSVQLKQLPIRFSACGFIDLNRGQVGTIFATIITYVVILLQNGAVAKVYAVIYNQ